MYLLVQAPKGAGQKLRPIPKVWKKVHVIYICLQTQLGKVKIFGIDIVLTIDSPCRMMTNFDFNDF